MMILQQLVLASVMFLSYAVPEDTGLSMHQENDNNIYVLSGSEVTLSCMGKNISDISWILPSGNVLASDGILVNGTDAAKYGVILNATSSRTTDLSYSFGVLIDDVRATDAGTYMCISSNKKEVQKFQVKVVELPPTPYQCHSMLEEQGRLLTFLCTTDYIPRDQFLFQLKAVINQSTKVTVAEGSQPRFVLDRNELESYVNKINGRLNLTICVVHIRLSASLACSRPVGISLDDHQSDDQRSSSGESSSQVRVVVPVAVCGVVAVCVAVVVGLVWRYRQRNGVVGKDDHSVLAHRPPASGNDGEINYASTSSVLGHLERSTGLNDEEQELRLAEGHTKLPKPSARELRGNNAKCRHKVSPMFSSFMPSFLSEESSDRERWGTLHLPRLAGRRNSHQIISERQEDKPRKWRKASLPTSIWYDGFTDDQKQHSLRHSKTPPQIKNGDSFSTARYQSRPRANTFSSGTFQSGECKYLHDPSGSQISVSAIDLSASSNTDIAEEESGVSSKRHYYKIPRSDKALTTASLPMRLKRNKLRRQTAFSGDCPSTLQTGDHLSTSMCYSHHPPHFPNFHVCAKHYRHTLDPSDRSTSLFSLEFVHQSHNHAALTRSNYGEDGEDDWQELPADISIVPPDLDLPPKLPKKTKTRSIFFLSSVPASRSQEVVYDIPRNTENTETQLKSEFGETTGGNKRPRLDSTLCTHESSKRYEMYSPFGADHIPNYENVHMQKPTHEKYRKNTFIDSAGHYRRPRPDRLRRSESCRLTVGHNDPASRSKLVYERTLTRSRSLSIDFKKKAKHFKRYWNKGDLLPPGYWSMSRQPQQHARNASRSTRRSSQALAPHTTKPHKGGMTAQATVISYSSNPTKQQETTMESICRGDNETQPHPQRSHADYINTMHFQKDSIISEV